MDELKGIPAKAEGKKKTFKQTYNPDKGLIQDIMWKFYKSWRNPLL
jgi:hypothetical protein